MDGHLMGGDGFARTGVSLLFVLEASKCHFLLTLWVSPCVWTWQCWDRPGHVSVSVFLPQGSSVCAPGQLRSVSGEGWSYSLAGQPCVTATLVSAPAVDQGRTAGRLVQSRC